MMLRPHDNPALLPDGGSPAGFDREISGNHDGADVTPSGCCSGMILSDRAGICALTSKRRLVKNLGPPLTAARLMRWKREWAAILADAETAQFQGRAQDQFNNLLPDRRASGGFPVLAI